MNFARAGFESRHSASAGDITLRAVRVFCDGEELLRGARALERRLGRHGPQRHHLGRGPSRVRDQQECEQKSHGFASTIMGNVLVERTSPGLPSTNGRDHQPHFLRLRGDRRIGARQ